MAKRQRGRPRIFGRPFVVQAVVFPKRKWTRRRAHTWLTVHGYSDAKPDDTKGAWRFRQRDPNDFVSLRGKCLTPSGAPASHAKCDVIVLGGPLRRGRLQLPSSPWWSWWS